MLLLLLLPPLFPPAVSGTSALRLRLTNDQFYTQEMSHIGTDYSRVSFEFSSDGTAAKLVKPAGSAGAAGGHGGHSSPKVGCIIWEGPVQERFRSLIGMYLRNAQVGQRGGTASALEHHCLLHFSPSLQACQKMHPFLTPSYLPPSAVCPPLH